MTTDAPRRDGDEPTRSTTAATGYTDLFREPQYLIELPPLEEDEALPGRLSSQA
ncbi:MULTISPECIES: hypothetical protein [unclassified Streptomyces]|uniref:hypothetical protein n=1 Tax=unclassified Streptomyces TaxID=2593676 RepID=UPI00331AC32E